MTDGLKLDYCTLVQWVLCGCVFAVIQQTIFFTFFRSLNHFSCIFQFFFNIHELIRYIIRYTKADNTQANSSKIELANTYGMRYQIALIARDDVKINSKSKRRGKNVHFITRKMHRVELLATLWVILHYEVDLVNSVNWTNENSQFWKT